MAAEVVGTAFVRIRAITEGLAKDIEKGVKKGIGKDAGDKLGGDIADNAVKTMKDGVEKGTADIDKSVDEKGGQKGGDKLGGALLDGFKKALDKGDFKGAGNLISKKINDDFKANFDADLAKAIDSGSLKEAEKLLKRRIKLSDGDGADSGRGFLAGLRRVFDDDDTGKSFGRRLLIGIKASFSGGDGGGLGSLLSFDFLDAIPGKFKLAALAAPALTAAVSAALQYVVSLVGQVGFLAEGLIGLGAAGGAAFGAIGLAALPLTLAFKAQTKALETFKKSLEGIGKQWMQVGAATQQTLLGPLTEALNMTTKLIPEFNAFGREVGRVVGQFAVWQASWLTNNENIARFRRILDGSIPILDALLGAAGNLIDVFLNLWDAAIPAGQDFARTLSHITDRLQNITAEAAASGALTNAINEWYMRGKLVIGALADIFIGIWNILRIGADSSVSFFTTFDNFAAKFRAFTESEAGQNKLGKIFEQANAIAHEFNGLIGDIIKAIGGEVFDAGGANGIIGFIKVLREDVVPFLDNFISQISGSYGPKLLELFKKFGDLLTTLDQTGALAGTLQTITTSLGLLNNILGALLAIPGFDKFLGYMLGLVTVLGALKLLGITKIAGGFISLSASLLGLEKGSSSVTVLKGIKGAISGFDFAGTFRTIGLAISGFATTLGEVVLAAAPYLLVIAAIAAAAYLIYRNWGTIKKFFGDIFDFLKRNFQTIGLVILTAVAPFIGIPLLIFKNWEKVKGFLGKIGGWFADVLPMVGRALAKVGEVILKAFITALTWVGTQLPGLILDAILYQFITLPLTIIGYLLTLGVGLYNAFSSAINYLGQAIPTMWQAVVTFFQEAPGKIVSFFDNLGESLGRVFTSAWEGVRNIVVTAWQNISSAVETGWQAVSSFFSELPGRVIGFISGLPERVGAVFTSVFDRARSIVSTGVDNVMSFFTGLPGRITAIAGQIGSAAEGIGRGVINGIGRGLSATAGFLGDLKDAVGSAMKSVINGFIRRLNDAIPNSIGPIDVPDNPIPMLGAYGGIFKKATNMIIGEAGTEALLPITKPNVMRRILQSNPEIAQAILAAMPTFDGIAAKITGITGAAVNTAVDTGRVVSNLTSTTVANTGGNVTVTMGAGAIVVSLQNATPDQAYAAGEQIAAGFNAAMADRQARINQRAI